MKNNFLKRFERLENDTREKSPDNDLRPSKRFELLEIGDTKIKLSIIDKVSPEETVATTIEYYILCAYCGRENAPESELCINCRQSLKSKLVDDYQVKARLLKKCSACDSVNHEDRRNCWVCGKEFLLTKKTNVSDDNVISLNIDGTDYKSTDKGLPLDIKMLIERIRKEGYKKEIIDEWIKNKNTKEELHLQMVESNLTEVRNQYLSRRNGLFIFGGLILFFILMRGCK